MNRVYVRCGMVPAPTDVIWDNHLHCDAVDYLVATRAEDGAVIGTVTGVDHERLFADPEQGSSLWTLAVDPAANLPGVGETLTRALADVFAHRGRAYMDLSVAHDNAAAIALYEKLGFQRVPVLAVKRKNAINESLFSPIPETVDDLNPYARIIADEALRRGIRVEVIDAETGEMRLSHGGRSVVTRESLSEYTSAVAMSRCDDKRLTRRIVSEAGVVVPRGRLATFDDGDHEFLAEVGDVVVKPTRGEQGKGITVGISDDAELDARTGPGPRTAPRGADRTASRGRGSAAGGDRRQGGGRRPAPARGGHRHRQAHRPPTHRGPEPTPGRGHRRRIADPGRRHHRGNGLRRRLVIRRGAAGRRTAARAPDREPAPGRHHRGCHRRGQPRTVPGGGGSGRIHRHPGDRYRPAGARRHGEPEYVFIEANERPGLANHEPQPTAAAFIDFLFPGQPGLPQAWSPAHAPE